VRLSLADDAAVRAACHEIGNAVADPQPAVLVQAMAAGQVELVAGIVHDQLFGSLVMVGLGGVHTELFADRAFRLVPMTDRDASRMWRVFRRPLCSRDTAVVLVSTLRPWRICCCVWVG